MIKKASKSIAPFVIGTLTGLVFVALVWGLQAAVKGIIPVAAGALAAFVFTLHSKK